MQRLARIAWRTAAQCANTARPVTEVCKLFRHRASSTSLPKTRGCHRPQRKYSWPNVATLVMGSISKICAMVFSPGASLVSAPALPLKKCPSGSRYFSLSLSIWSPSASRSMSTSSIPANDNISPATCEKSSLGSRFGESCSLAPRHRRMTRRDGGEERPGLTARKVHALAENSVGAGQFHPLLCARRFVETGVPLVCKIILS
jgi:hypothetical protein